MLVAVRRALEIRAEQRIEGVATEAQLERAIAAAGVELWRDQPLVGRVLGLFHDGVICVRRGLLPGTMRVVLAHELGHAVLGHGDGFYLRWPGGERPARSAEALAQVFAFCLLAGRPTPTSDGLTELMQIASATEIPIDFLLTAASILAYRTPAVRGTPLLALS